MIGWHHRLSERECEPTLGGSEGQGDLALQPIGPQRVRCALATEPQLTFRAPLWLSGQRILQIMRGRFDPCFQKIPCRRKWQPNICYLENPMDRGAWWVTVHGVSKELDMN